MSHKGKKKEPFEPKKDGEATPEAKLLRRIEELEQLLASSKDQALRLAAEMDNLRKRMSREKSDLLKYGNERLLLEILHIKDSLELALHHRESSDAKTLEDGIILTEKQLDQILERFSVKTVEAAGQTFDPNQHEALGQEPSSEHPAGTVIKELQKGYCLHDRLLRPSRVVIAQAPLEASQDVSKDDPKKDA